MHLLKYNIHLPSEGHSWWVLGIECQSHHLIWGGGWPCKGQFAARTRWLSCNWINKAKDNSQEKDKPDERTKERGQTLDLKVNGLVSLRKSYGSTTANIYTVWSLTTRTRGQGQQGVALHKEAKRPPMNPTNSNLYIESSCSFKVDPFLTAIE